MHTELVSHNARVDFLDEALKVSRKKLGNVKVVFESDWARSDAAGPRMVELSYLHDEAGVLNATCCEELFHLQKNLTIALEVLKATVARVVAVTKEQYNVGTKYGNLCSNMGQCIGFAHKRMACVTAEVVKVA